MKGTAAMTKPNRKRSSNLLDNPFYRLMGTVGDLVILNVLWLLCSLPVVTAGAAALGLFAVVHKIAAGEDYRAAADFFKAFRRDFVQGTGCWLVLLAGGCFAVLGLRAAGSAGTVLNGLLAAASFLLGVGVCCCGCWGLALLARFTYRRGLLALLDGARMTAANLLPTVGILVLLVWMPLLWVLAPGWFVYLLLPLFLVGGSATALGMTALMRPAVARVEQAGRKPEPPRDPLEEDETDGEDDLT